MRLSKDPRPFASMLPVSQDATAESPVALELAMPLKSDSTAMRLPMTEAITNATSVAAAIRRRLTIKRRFGTSGMALLGERRPAHKRNGAARGTRNRGRMRWKSSPSLLRQRVALPIRQRGLGRNGGRAVRERGRMRKRGPSGGGTLRRRSPQQGQRPSPPRGAVASARSQRPRASHCGLIHCTVKPGKNCIFSPSVAKAQADSCAAARLLAVFGPRLKKF